MDVDELMKRAWAAVEASGVPEGLQPAAFKEAVDFLRSDGQDLPDEKARHSTRGTPSNQRNARTGSKTGQRQTEDIPVDEATFFSNLAAESGEDEQDLRDVIKLTGDNKVQVMPPPRKFGDTTANQAKNVLALVAAGRGRGLGERPVKADAVRDELKRKNCFSSNNFAAKHLGPMKGFNSGSDRSEIELTAKWLPEFKAAMNLAHERAPDESAN